jgi:SAM-dependent methyltransferase
MTGVSPEMRGKAEEILAAMGDDVALVPEHLAEWWSNYLRYHHVRYLETLAFLDGAAGDVLEVGSIPAQFTALLQALGFKVQGVDLAPERVRGFLDRHGLDVQKVDIETDRLPFSTASVGTVLFAEVLEHLRINPLHALREASRVLRPGGRLILSTPNVSPLQKLMFLMGRDYQGNIVEEFRKLETVGHMGHFRLYSLGDIQGLLREVGLEFLSVQYRGELETNTWKTRLFRSLYPRKDRLRPYVYVTATKP